MLKKEVHSKRKGFVFQAWFFSQGLLPLAFFCGWLVLLFPNQAGGWKKNNDYFRFTASHLRLMWSISRANLETFKSGILSWFCTFCVIIEWMIVHLPTWQFALKQTCWGFGGFKFGCVFFKKIHKNRCMEFDTWISSPINGCHVMTEPCGAHGLRGPKDAEVQVVYSLHRSTFGSNEEWVVGRFFGWAEGVL